MSVMKGPERKFKNKHGIGIISKIGYNLSAINAVRV